MKKVSITLGALSLVASGFATLGAQDTPMRKPGMVDPTRVSGGIYSADSKHSLVAWRVDHLGFNDYFGLFGNVTGTLAVDPAKPGQAKVDVMVPVNSVTVVNPDLRAHLLRPGKEGGKPDFFGPEPAPARFVSTRVTLSPSRVTGDVAGELTLNGVTKPVTLYVRFTGAGISPGNKAETIGFEGRTTIKRSDFGLGFLVPMVGNDVDLEITAAFEKKPG